MKPQYLLIADILTTCCLHQQQIRGHDKIQTIRNDVYALKHGHD